VAITGAAGPAGASAGPSRLGTERFQIMTTSPTARKLTIIATGVFTDGGTLTGDLTQGVTGRAVLRSGTFKIISNNGSGAGIYDPADCLNLYQGNSTYELRDGTGKYARIQGSGRFSFKLTTIYARNSKGTCTSAVAAYQELITLHGPARA
jgi:hypothetical protein